MPELPEVETIRCELAPRVTGRSITGVALEWPRMVQIPPAEAFMAGLAGQRIARLERRGKFLIFQLASGDSLIVHFRMSGSLLLDTEGESDPYVRAIFRLDNGSRLRLRDPRKLGRMYLVSDASQVVGKLGPEPLGNAFTVGAFERMLARRSAPIKAVLCDQAFLAGVGNMYADEALFTAGIHPLRRACDLSPQDTERLHRSIRSVLQQAIAGCGASISDYYRPGGESGTAQFTFRVAHRKGQPCPVCGTPIERVMIRQRGSYFCPACQPV